jgi:hypothetical protein
MKQYTRRTKALTATRTTPSALWRRTSAQCFRVCVHLQSRVPMKRELMEILWYERTWQRTLQTRGGTCMVAMRDEKIIGEWYSGGRKATDSTIAFSSGKPLSAAVIGAAVRLGRLKIDQSVADFIPEFKDTPKAAITIRHLMTHTSGLEATKAGPAIIAHTLNSEALKLSLTTSQAQHTIMIRRNLHCNYSC